MLSRLGIGIGVSGCWRAQTHEDSPPMFPSICVYARRAYSTPKSAISIAQITRTLFIFIASLGRSVDALGWHYSILYRYKYRVRMSAGRAQLEQKRV